MLLNIQAGGIHGALTDPANQPSGMQDDGDGRQGPGSGGERKEPGQGNSLPSAGGTPRFSGSVTGRRVKYLRARFRIPNATLKVKPDGVDGLTDTPGSVLPCRYRRGSSGHPSTDAVADALQRPTRTLGRAALKRVLSGLAPGGVYLAFPVTREAGGLLHHRFTLTCFVPLSNRPTQAVCSLWHWPAGYPEWALPTTLPCGARTFLEPLA